MYFQSDSNSSDLKIIFIYLNMHEKINFLQEWCQDILSYIKGSLDFIIANEQLGREYSQSKNDIIGDDNYESGDGSLIRKQTLRAEDRRRDLRELKWVELTVKQKNNKYRGIQKTVLLLLF